MAYPKGKPNPNAGRPKGAPNKDVETMRMAWVAAFNELQSGPSNLVAWAETNPTDFYKLAKSLIPMQVQADITSNGETIRPINVHVEVIDRNAGPAEVKALMERQIEDTLEIINIDEIDYESF